MNLKESTTTTYVYHWIGCINSHIIKSIRSVNYIDPNSEIYLLTTEVECAKGQLNQNNLNNVKVIDIKEIESNNTKDFNDNVFRIWVEGGYNDKLFRSSLMRIFHIRDFMYNTNTEYFTHFDTDVILYKNFEFYRDYLSDFDGLQITKCDSEIKTKSNTDVVVFGFSRFGKKEKINKICDYIYNIFYEEKNITLFGEWPTEMGVLGYLFNHQEEDLIRTLKNYPYESDVLFDPSQYGVYIYGTHMVHCFDENKMGPGHIIGGEESEFGKKILSNEYELLVENDYPYLKWEDKLYPIVNLHLHCKDQFGHGDKFISHIKD